MLNEEIPTMDLRGSYHDVVRDAAGQVTWDSGWQKNTIVLDCRRLLAGFMKGEADTLGIQGIQFGAGSSDWDVGLPPPPPLATNIELDDQNPFQVSRELLKLDYLDPVTGLVSVSPTNRLQIVATLGPQGPKGWPADWHSPPTLREFGLVGQLGLGAQQSKQVLINAVRHVAIPMDPASTLVRTIHLVF